MHYFAVRYSNLITQSYEYLSNAYDVLVADINSFVDFFSKAIELFYNLKVFMNAKFVQTVYPNLFNSQSVKLFALEIIFQNEFISKLITEIQIFLDKKKPSRSKTKQTPNPKELHYLRPEDFEVPSALCLNLKTFDQSFCAPQGFDNFSPYQSIIDSLQILSSLKSPLQKLKLIMEIGTLVRQEILKFYQKNNLSVQTELTNDDFIPVYLFILVKAAIPNLVSHCNIIEKFLDAKQLKYTNEETYSYCTIRAVSYTHLTLPTKRIVQISVVGGSLKKKIDTRRRTWCIVQRTHNNERCRQG
eukprot:TRINITY_DN11236_c0_g1_i2.p1 TRINITY_DN11236_c0_g1~~TRINITY_DN11236_c0_g1_i2.p1  ORF type:complete len:301 (-),score=34.16 TRINITY_DN11236_c0_g1_i2:33-935(-)